MYLSKRIPISSKMRLFLPSSNKVRPWLNILCLRYRPAAKIAFWKNIASLSGLRQALRLHRLSRVVSLRL